MNFSKGLLTSFCATLILAFNTGCDEEPMVIANYFIDHTGGEVITGKGYTLEGLRQGTGLHNGDFAEAKPERDPQGHLSFGPYITKCQIKNKLKSLNPSLSQEACTEDGSKRGEALNFRIDYHLSSNTNSFSQKPVATLDVVGSKSGTLRSRKIYPQDFYKGKDTLHTFSFGLSDYEAQDGERLEFRVYWHKNFQLVHFGTEIRRAKFRPVYGSWVLYDQSQMRRSYDAHFVQTYYEERDGTLSRLENREVFYRDIQAGNRGT